LILICLFIELLAIWVYCQSMPLSEVPIYPFSLYTNNADLLLEALGGKVTDA